MWLGFPLVIMPNVPVVSGKKVVRLATRSFILLPFWCHRMDVDGWMDDLRFYVLFNSISIISGR